MPKYGMVVEAEEYRIGLEDGFDCWSINNCELDDPTIESCKTCAHARPYLDTNEGAKYILVGSYIVTYPDGCKVSLSASEFATNFKPIVE